MLQFSGVIVIYCIAGRQHGKKKRIDISLT